MRREFSKVTKREALKRSGGNCEAVGIWYGLDDGKRCGAILSYGITFDHVIADSHGGENTLENCAAICLGCHAIKTRKMDVPIAAKIKRQSDKHLGITKTKRKWPSRKFGQ
jgi:hypothetical protein